jgi:hypothetical protein
MTSKPTASKPTASKQIDQTIFNAAVKASRNAAKNVNNAAWIIGDAAQSVQASYGQGKVQAFADAIGIVYKTALDFRAVAEAYAPADRSSLNSWTVHQIFMRQLKRAELVKTQKWTTSAARAENKRLNGSDNVDPIDGDGDGEGGNEPTVTDPRAKLVANIDRLKGQLAVAKAALAAYDAENDAENTPAGTLHFKQSGIPSHDVSEPRTDCKECTAAGVVPMPAPRRSRSRKPTAAKAA